MAICARYFLLLLLLFTEVSNALDLREISIIFSAVVVILQLILVHDTLSELFRVVRLEAARPPELLAALVDPLVGHF